MTWLTQDKSVPRHMLNSVRIVIFGGASTSKDTVISFRDAYPQIQIVAQTYGLTETTSVTHALLPAREYMDQFPDTIGYLLSNMTCKIVHPETGEASREGEPGELWIKSPTNMVGYWNRPDTTDEVFDADGFFKTGDLVYMNEEDMFFVTGRLKDVIKVKGYQVSPNELEGILLKHPDVSDAAVIGWGSEDDQRPLAFVVPGAQNGGYGKNKELDTSSVMDFVNGQLSPYKHISAIKCVDSIPKSPSGKILRRLLIEQLGKSLSKSSKL